MKAALVSRASSGLAENTANCGSTERRASWGFGESEYLVSTWDGFGFAVEAVVVGVVVVADSVIDAVVFDKATLAMG